MTVSKEKSIMKNSVIYCAATFILLTLAACGGGGVINPPAKTAVTLKVNLTGTLPAGTSISGAAFTLTLPANVTPLIINNSVAGSVVSLSGTFAGGTQTPPVYTAATANSPGTLQLSLVNGVPAGITQVGEVATIVLQLANGVTPTAGDFSVSAVSVIDAQLYNTISNMGANVAAVTLQ